MLTPVPLLVIAALSVSATARRTESVAPSSDASRIQIDKLGNFSQSFTGHEENSVFTLGTTSRSFDVRKAADNALWLRYVAKGQHLNCLMKATDLGAGNLVMDNRNPPSASSQWNADHSNLQKWFWHEETDFECNFNSLAETFSGHAAQVLLGSPNGLAVGYFLAQHKHKFGKNKSVEKITVFLADEGTLPFLLFRIIDAPAGPVQGGLEEGGGMANETRVGYEGTRSIVKRSRDGRSVVRQHVFRAKL